MKNIITSSILFLAVLLCQAQTKEWIRHTAISPDGSQIAFTAKGDIYLAPVAGGKASKLTTHAAYDTKPVWSNDGGKIAFASDRNGNFDVFVINVAGGSAQRLTYHSARDLPTDFSADDKNVLFNSTRMDAQASMLHPRLGELYSVDLNGSLPKQLLSIPAWEAQTNQSGDILFEEVKGIEDDFRKHHTSSVTRDIWIKTSAGQFTRLSAFEGEDRDPVFGQGDNVFYLSEKNGSQNVYQSSLSNPDQLNQVSNFKDHPVRYLSISNSGLLCYNFNGGIYTQTPGSEPLEVKVDISGDESIGQENLLFVSGGVSDMVPSPNGKEIAFIYRGDVFVTTVEGSFTRRLTNTPGQERSLDISKDGRSIVYAGERNNSWNIYLQKIPKKEEKYFVNALELKEEVLLASNAETFQPKFSPDGKEVAFLEERTQLRKINVETKEITTIHRGESNFSYADGDQTYTWSPDGKWFLISYYPAEYWVDEVGLISADGNGTIRNMSKSGFYDGAPKWSKDGSVIYWESNRDGMRSAAGSGSSTTDIYGLFLTQKAFDKFNLSKTEFELMGGDDDKKEEKKEDDKKKKKKKGDDKEDKKDEVKPIKIEYEGLSDRKKKFSLFSASVADFVMTHDKKHLFILSRIERKFELWKINLRTRETKSISTFSGWGGMQLGAKGKKLYILSRGRIYHIDVSSGDKESVSIDGEMSFDLVSERKYLIEHVSRQVEKKFLDKDLHGTPWSMMTENYKQFVPNLNNDYDFQDLLSELLGELNASHTGASYYNYNSKGDATASLGVFYDTNYTGAGIRISEIMDKSPLINEGRKIKVGTIIEQIDGQTISAGSNFYRLLNRKSGKMTIISFHNPTIGERWKERIKPVSQRTEREMRYQRWMKRNRELTHQLSNNQIGYVHIRSMSDGSYREFLDKVMGEEYDKKALIVDTRFNGGGDLVDDINTFLSGEVYQKFQTRDKILGYESQRRWTKPSIMLVGEGNYSDAHCTPAAYRDLGIGKIVGMPVPGTCSFVWWERMQNGMVFGIPNMQVLDKAGDVLENKQLEPDFEVKNEFDKVVAGEDQQIAKAVEELLKEVE